MKMGIGSPCASFGKALDIKFQHAEQAALERDEQVLARFFSPSYEKKYRAWGLFPAESREGGDYIAVTNFRLFWITERTQNCRESDGSILRYAPLGNVLDVAVHHTGRNWGVICRLKGGTSWCVPLPAEQSGDAAAFADRALSVLNSSSFAATD
jgi:hypothetical protein